MTRKCPVILWNNVFWNLRDEGDDPSLTCGDAEVQHQSSATEPCSSDRSASPPPRRSTPAQLRHSWSHCTSLLLPTSRHQSCPDPTVLDTRREEILGFIFQEKSFHIFIWHFYCYHTFILNILAAFDTVCTFSLKTHKHKFEKPKNLLFDWWHTVSWTIHIIFQWLWTIFCNKWLRS